MVKEEEEEEVEDRYDPLICDVCGQRCKTKLTLKTHKESRCSRLPLVCDQKGCSFTTKAEWLLKLHSSRQHGIKSFKCNIDSCKSSFRTLHKLKVHKKFIHNSVDKRFKCSNIGCDFQTNIKGRILSHKAVHKGTSLLYPFACVHCPEKYESLESLKVHLKVCRLKSGENLLNCKVNGCQSIHGSKVALQKHMLKHRMRDKSVVMQKKFLCGQIECDFQTDCESELDLHHKQHWNAFQFVCAVEGCGQRYGKSWELTLHTRAIHSEKGRKVFVCPLEGCGKTFNSHTSFGNHKIKHSETVLFCDWPGCHYSSKLKTNLRNHMTVHYSNESFACEWPECKKSFKRKSYLENHMRIHNNDKKYACLWPGCQYRCTDNGNIHKHMKQVHKVMNRLQFQQQSSGSQNDIQIQ